MQKYRQVATKTKSNKISQEQVIESISWLLILASMAAHFISAESWTMLGSTAVKFLAILEAKYIGHG